jgi:hypothetical protein
VANKSKLSWSRVLSSRPRFPHWRDGRQGQSLVEFALILPILLLLVGGIIQYGVIFATKHSLVQVGRDTGRWAATQSFSPCHDATIQSPPQPVTEADALAQQSGLLGYAPGNWNSSNLVRYLPDGSALPPTPPNTEGVEVVWSPAGVNCPTVDNTTAAFVTIRLSHRAPVLLPGFPYLPGLGTCDASGCYLVITTTAQFRMEPPPP